MPKLDPTKIVMKDVSLDYLIKNAIPDRDDMNYRYHDVDASRFLEALISGFPMGFFVGSYLTTQEKEEFPDKLFEIHTIGDYRMQYIRWFLDGTAKLDYVFDENNLGKTFTTISPEQRKTLLEKRVSLVIMDASLTNSNDFDYYQNILLSLFAS